MLRKKCSSMDLYGKIPIELNEPSEVGGLFSMGAAVVMFVLFYIELFGFLQYTVEGTAIAGYGIGAQQAINPQVRILFNISMLSLPCEYTVVDVLDVLGQNALNVTGAIKMTELGTNIVKEILTNISAPLREPRKHVERDYEEDNIDISLGQGSSLLELDESNFIDIRRKYPWTCIHFFHPSSVASIDLMSTWEALSEHMKYDRKMGQALNIAVVNCETSNDLCSKELKIRQFPTIRAYHGDGYIEKGLYNKDGTTLEHLLNILTNFIDFDSGGQPEKVTKKLLLQDTANLTKGDQGCNVQVPGNFHIEARGPEGRDINPQLANLSHVVHNFQVNQLDNADTSAINPMTWKKIPEAYYQFQAMDGRSYVSEAQHTSYVHHIRIVFTEYIVDTFYGKSIANGYQLRAMSENIQFLDYVAPEARFTFDFSPISMRVTLTRTSWTKFIVGLMAILGGTYSVVGLADAICERFNPMRRQSIGRTLR